MKTTIQTKDGVQFIRIPEELRLNEAQVAELWKVIEAQLRQGEKKVVVDLSGCDGVPNRPFILMLLGASRLYDVKVGLLRPPEDFVLALISFAAGAMFPLFAEETEALKRLNPSPSRVRWWRRLSLLRAGAQH